MTPNIQDPVAVPYQTYRQFSDPCEVDAPEASYQFGPELVNGEILVIVEDLYKEIENNMNGSLEMLLYTVSKIELPKNSGSYCYIILHSGGEGFTMPVDMHAFRAYVSSNWRPVHEGAYYKNFHEAVFSSSPRV